MPDQIEAAHAVAVICFGENLGNKAKDEGIYNRIGLGHSLSYGACLQRNPFEGDGFCHTVMAYQAPCFQVL